MRLAAKLLGWRIDIKSEEEKRQEVESAMAALVAPGAPVSVLIDYGLGEKLAEKLVESGVATVEKLGSMTPEELEEIQGIGPRWWRRFRKRSTRITRSLRARRGGRSGGGWSRSFGMASAQPRSRGRLSGGDEPGRGIGSPEAEVRGVGFCGGRGELRI